MKKLYPFIHRSPARWDAGGLNLKIFDILAQKVYEKISHEKIVEVNCNLAKGIYQLQVETNSGILIKKLIIQ